MLTAIATGVLFGLYIPEFMLSISLIGEMFLRLLTLLVVPIIVLSILSGVTNIQSSGNLARIGIKTFIYYTVTTALAVCIGLVMVNTIQPGKGQSDNKAVQEIMQTDKQDSRADASLTDVIKNIVPKNIFEAAAQGNVLGLIFFCFFLGVALLSIKHPAAQSARDLIAVLFEATIWMVEKTMLLAPLGFLSLTASVIAEYVIDNKLMTFGSAIGWYTLTVVLGLLFHGIVVLPLILRFFKVNPLRFAKVMAPALTTAFSTASSAATLPVTLDRLEKNAGVSNKISSFVVPLGATVNMDGTAIYEAVAVIFIANMLGVELTFSQQILVFLTATFSANGAAGIPGAGLIMMVLILNTVGLPPDGVKLVLLVDRLLDMMRTCLNVWGDSIGAAVVARSENEILFNNEAV